MKKILALGILLFFVLAIIPVYAKSNLDAKSKVLQEKCAEEAKKFFLERIDLYGGTWGEFSNENEFGWNKFQSHYNRELDKCFIRIVCTRYPKNRKEDEPIFYSIELFDVFEGEKYGSFWREQYKNYNWPLTRCEVGTNKCTNEQEFENLIRSYMEQVKGK
jgi:hypothetical protein